MYLEQRRRTWYALHSIPPKARAIIGKDRFVKSLGTDSRQEAERRASTLEPKWRAQIQRALASDPDGLEREFGLWRQRIEEAESEADREEQKGLLVDELERRDREAARRQGIDPYDLEAVRETAEHADNVEAYRYATGQKVPTDERLEEYLSSLEGFRKPKTIKMRRGVLQRLTERMPYLDEVTGDAVQRYVNERMRNGTGVETVKREQGEYKDYWRYLRSLNLVPKDHKPFDDLYFPNPSTKRDRRWIGFTRAEAVQLLHVAERKRADKNLPDLIRLCMFTGARIGELSHLKVDDVDNGFLVIRDAKTPAGIRDVPIHPTLQPVVDRLVADSGDGYLLPHEAADEYGDRSTNPSKRFGHLKRKLGFSRQHVFHSLRRTVTTCLVNAGVLEAQADDITGHESPGMSYGYYSDGSWRETTRAAIVKLEYPDLAVSDMG